MNARVLSIWLGIWLIVASTNAFGAVPVTGQGGLGLREQLSVVFFPRYEAVLSAEVKAKVLHINREFGQSFAKGQTLISLDPSLYRLEVEKAKVLLEAAESVYKVTTTLYRDKSVSTLEMEKAAMELAVAKVNQKRVLRDLNGCTIVAPFAGRVEKLLVNEHELVEPGRLLMKIVDDHIIRARIILPSNLFGNLVLGRKLLIKVNETGREVVAAVTHISAAMDPASGTFEVYAEVDNFKGCLRSGMTGKLVGGEGGR